MPTCGSVTSTLPMLRQEVVTEERLIQATRQRRRAMGLVAASIGLGARPRGQTHRCTAWVAAGGVNRASSWREVRWQRTASSSSANPEERPVPRGRVVAPAAAVTSSWNRPEGGTRRCRAAEGDRCSASHHVIVGDCPAHRFERLGRHREVRNPAAARMADTPSAAAKPSAKSSADP